MLKDEDTRTDAVKRVGGKTFYLIEGVWTDSEFKAESGLPETVLVFGSDEYFALLKQYPKLGSYFSLGERVVIVLDGRVYRVTANINERTAELGHRPMPEAQGGTEGRLQLRPNHLCFFVLLCAQLLS